SAPLGQLALRDPPEAQRLGQVAPEAREPPAGRRVEAPDELCRHERPARVVLDQVAPDLEIAIPAEVGRVLVRGQAGEAGLERDAERRPGDAYAAPIAVQIDRNPRGERKSVRRDQREDGGLV